MPFKHFKCLLTFFFTLTSFAVFSQQNFQGKAYYYSKTQVNIGHFEKRDISEEQKKRIIQRMKDMFQKEFILVFNKTESLFKIKEKLGTHNQKGGGGRFRAMITGANDGNLYKNIQTKELLKDAELFGKKFLITDSLKAFSWKMTGETKKIGKYTCFKATATKKITNKSDFSPTPPKSNSFNRTKTQPEEKDIQVIVWYTMQIPVSHGPQDFWGLPGLILEVNAGRTTILCSKIILNPMEKVKIKKPKKGKKISKDAYVEISDKKMKEMRDNFRTRRTQNSGNRNRRQ